MARDGNADIATRALRHRMRNMYLWTLRGTLKSGVIQKQLEKHYLGKKSLSVKDNPILLSIIYLISSFVSLFVHLFIHSYNFHSSLRDDTSMSKREITSLLIAKHLSRRRRFFSFFQLNCTGSHHGETTCQSSVRRV